MALSADANRVSRASTRISFRLANTGVVFGGSFSALKTNSFGTAADRGFADVFEVADGILPLGGWFLGYGGLCN